MTSQIDYVIQRRIERGCTSFFTCLQLIRLREILQNDLLYLQEPECITKYMLWTGALEICMVL